jgi:hypothetical protein
LLWNFKVYSTNNKRVPIWHYSSESRVSQTAPWAFDSSHPWSLAGGGRGTEIRWPCFGGEGHRRRGEASGAHGGLIGPCVEGIGGREGDLDGSPKRRWRVSDDGDALAANVGEGPARKHQ